MHQFHIPVMGISFSIDTPLKIARYGISSAISLGNDAIMEDMRAYYCKQNNLFYEAISEKKEDYRAKRITAYLNLIDDLVKKQLSKVASSSLVEESEIVKYLQLLPEISPLKQKFKEFNSCVDLQRKKWLEKQIREGVVAGSIDVNIMTKLNKSNKDANGKTLGAEYGDALSAFRGFANSNLQSSIIFSAGFNGNLYNYIGQFPDFFPDENGIIKKKIILKVSDYRSAIIQGKFLAKKGIWVTEFRIESGLNCGGHAFPTQGILMGPILQEFLDNREELKNLLFSICITKWTSLNLSSCLAKLDFNISVQGGIGTYEEHQFLINEYKLNSTGWGTPFLLVPEATNVDANTLQQLQLATVEDLYLSDSSPLGVPFNNLRNTASDELRKKRIEESRPGSPCIQKHLISNTEFATEPICTASRKYQNKKIEELRSKNLQKNLYNKEYNKIVAKACLCEDLSATAYINYNIKPILKAAPAVCPGPNMAFFSRIFTLQEMADHIYGKISLLNYTYRPHMFINELKLYIEYLENEWIEITENIDTQRIKYLNSFKENLEAGIRYYKKKVSTMLFPTFEIDLLKLSRQLQLIG